MNKDSPIFKGIAIFVILSSLSFFMFRGTESIGKLMELAGIGVLVLFLLLNTIYFKIRINHPLYYKWPVIFIMCSVILSAFACNYYYNQSFSISFYQVRSYYFYLFYFFLNTINFKREYIEKIFLYTCIAYSCVYLAQYLIYPTLITYAKIMAERGTVRIFMFGWQYAFIGFFLVFNKILKKFNIVHLGLVMLFMGVVFFLGSRQFVATVILIAALVVLLRKKVKNRVLIIVLSGIVGFSAFLYFNEVVQGMVEESEKDSEKGSDYVRFKSVAYYLDDFQPSVATRIIGNGEPNVRSAYGRKIFKLNMTRGYFLSDIGIFGMYVKHGALIIIGIFVFAFRIIFSKTREDGKYLKDYIFIMLMTMFTTLMEVGRSDGAVFLCLVFYLHERYKYSWKDEWN
ncbi:MAG: hypothetical protein MI922_19615 [Bacteroidales bacterium]|nr:hypothetical protein [Bacteroidales bacterium]